MAATAPRQLGRYRCTDTLGVRDGVIGWTRPAARVRDQPEQEEENGKLNLHIMDAGRLRLRARRAKDGTLELRHESEAEETQNDAADPDVVGTSPATGGDPATAAGRTSDNALAQWRRTNRAEFHMAGLAEYQRKLDDHYGQR
jgi:hypothetical protein